MKTKLILLFLIGSITQSIAQQLPVFTQYREFHGIINPATLNSDYTNYEYNLSFGVSSRIQWSGLEGAPRTSLVRGEYIFDNHGTGLLVGGYILQDRTGPTSTTGVYGRIAGIISDGDPYFGGLSIGLNFGAAQFRIDASDIEFVDAGDFAGADNQYKIYPDVGAGIYFYRQLDGGGIFDGDNVYVGLSVPQVFGLDLTFTNELGDFSVTKVQHYFGLIGLYKYFSEDSFWEPSIWVKYVPGASVQVDFNSRVQWSRNFWLGAGIANNKNFHLETGFMLGDNVGWDHNIKIGYGYDHSFTTFGPFAGSTHEINVAIALER